MGAGTSYEELDNAQRPRVERLCRLLLADVHEAQDVAQEVLIKLFRAQQARHAGMAWDPWVTRVTVNACRDRRRSAWWRRLRDGHAPLIEEHLTGPGSSPEDALVAAETRHRIWAATAEVAETLDLSTGSAKRHLFRAVQRLRDALQGTP